MVNVAPAPDDPTDETMREILANVDVLVANETEAEVLLAAKGNKSVSVETVEEAKVASRDMLKQIGD